MERNTKSLRRLSGVWQKRNQILFALVRYAILIGIGFVFLYPVLYMIVNSFKSVEDLVDPGVEWIPSTLCFDNFVKAFRTLDFGKSFQNSLVTSAIPAVFQTFSCAVCGYGLARFPVPGKKFILGMIVATFVVPAQITLIPKYLMFSNYKMLNTVLPQILPALFGQGLKSSIFILVFQNFFKSYPMSLDEAAYLDGAGTLTVFFRVALPLAKPAIVVTLLFSFVWYWNETTQAALLFGTVIKTLPMKLGSFASSYTNLYGSTGSSSTVNEAVSFAGTFLSVLPLLVLYLVLQKQFVESIEKVGITGE